MSTTAEELASLREHPFTRALAEPQLERLFRCWALVQVAPGEFVFREGDRAESLYLLRAGQIALEQNVPGRGPVTMETLRGGDVLGFSWMFEDERWTLDARAVEPTEMVALDGACVRRQMLEDPALGLAIATQLVHQLYHRLERVRLQRLDVYRNAP